MAACDEFKVLGIKRTPSKDGDREYVTFNCAHAYTDYELDKSKCEGFSVESVQASEDFGVKIGDVIEFKYGKALPTKNGGVFQPVKGVIFIDRAGQTK